MHLHLLGQPRVISLGQSQPVLGYGALVLAWLALHGRSDALPSRLRLARALWPDEDDDQARRRLTNALYRLKRDFPELEEHLTGDAHGIGLRGMTVDALELERQMGSPDPADWQAALEAYSGDLLEDSDAPWLEEWRAGLRELFLGGLQKLLNHQADDPVSATRTAQRWLAADPLSEEAHTALIRLYAAQGRSAEALAQYGVLEQTLKRELNAAPRRETQAFAHSLRPSDGGYRSLVGRTKELRAFADQLTALKAGRGGVVVLEGEPGMGKSRLLEEVAQLAKWHRLGLLRGTASEQHETPYAPLDLAVRGAGSLLEAASPLMRETLKPLLEPSPDDVSNSSSGAVGAALERWLHKLDEPLALLLDDLQWAGDLFWALLPVLARTARQRGLLLVLAHRSQELQTEPFALEALTNLRREGAVLHLELSGLSQEECAALAKGFGKTLDEAELDRLYRLSSGNPLVFGEFMQGGSAQHLEELLRQRFGRLDGRAREALVAASVLGSVFEGAVWAAMLDFVPPLERLVEARFLHQEEAKLTFQHDLIRSLIYKSMTQEQRQTWHTKALNILRLQNERAAVLAYHALEAGLYQECSTLYAQAAREAMMQSSFVQADKHLKLARTYLPKSGRSPATALELRLLEMQLSYAVGPTSEALGELDALEAELRSARQGERVIEALTLRVKAMTAKGDLAGFRAAADRLLAETVSQGNLEREVAALNEVAVNYSGRFVDPTTALALAEKAENLTATYDLPHRLRYGALNALITCFARQKNLPEMERRLNEAERLFESYPSLAGFEVSLRLNRGLLCLFQDRYEEAVEAFKKQLEASRITGHSLGASLALQNLTLSLKMTGQYREALVWADEMAEMAQARQGKLDPNRTAFYLSTLAELLAFQGRPDEAEAVLQPVMTLVDGQGAGEGEIKVRTVMAVVRRAQGRYLEGYRYLLTNVELFAKNPANQVTVQLFAAEMVQLAGLHAEARDLLRAAAPQKAALGKTFGQIWWRYVSYLVEGQPTDLEEARLIGLSFATSLKGQAVRRNFLDSHYPQAVQRLWAAQDLETLTVELPSADGSSKLPVTWTLDSGASDKGHFAGGGKVGLRHHRLRRLVLEAAVEGAVPMQSELAEALGVSLRTLEADLAALREQGIELKTLGMRRETAQ